jgi:hypothetical protein
VDPFMVLLATSAVAGSRVRQKAPAAKQTDLVAE